MAKPKENTLFEEPEFDEKEFLTIERDRGIGIIVIFVIGALSGVLAGYLQIQGYVYLSVLVMLAVLLVLTRILKTLGIKVSDKASHRIINYGMYIFTWLLFWIILLNPPLNVVSSPQIHTFQVDQNGTWTNLTTFNSTGDYSGLVGTNQYSIHLTYRYAFQPGTLYYKQGSSDVNVKYTGGPGYLNFTLTSSYGNAYNFYLDWSSNASSNPHPLEFTMVV
ncbi:MAG: hypothetical protein M1129_02390 [Candidatus Thermoplasmatota archaeon]|jgi:hypothetical protein|nr:hypothetical protein [Candidatus Thermoplasmatota archaeon]MCL5955505.1 hypothetical protein [Candidatus Thermoplasmatota archaeon]